MKKGKIEKMFSLVGFEPSTHIFFFFGLSIFILYYVPGKPSFGRDVANNHSTLKLQSL